MHFVGILIDGLTSPSGESKHQFWNNLCNLKKKKLKLTLIFKSLDFQLRTLERYQIKNYGVWTTIVEKRMIFSCRRYLIFGLNYGPVEKKNYN